MDWSELERLIAAREAATVLGISEYQLYALAREGIVPAVRIGRAVRFSPSALAEFVARGGKGFEGRWRKQPSQEQAR